MPVLPTRPLGSSGMDLTVVGLGTGALGGAGWAFAWGHQDDDTSVATIRHALEQGVNWIDTAAIYGLGHAETLVARALHGLPDSDRPYVFTKCGQLWDPADRGKPPRRVGDPASLRRGVEASLRRLEAERIDLLQMHHPPQDGTPLERYWQTLLDLKAEGKVHAVGLSNHDHYQLQAAERLGCPDSLQARLSLIDRQIAEAELPWCQDRRIGVIVYSPLHSGLLTGTFSQAEAAALPPGDWRVRAPEFTGERLTRNLTLARALAPVAERHATTVAAVAIAWTLAWPGVTGAIVGARQPAHVDGWLPAAALLLDPTDLDAIHTALASTRAGRGPTRPPGTTLGRG